MKKNIFAILMIAAVVIINIISIVVFKEINILACIASIAGVTSAALSAKGYISCYYIGLINNVAYLIIAYYSHFYGTLLLQLLFVIPMQFIGIYNWKKHLTTETKTIKTKKMTTGQLILIITIDIIVSFAYSMFLKLIGSNSIFLDSIITTTSIIGVIMFVKRYQEIWLFGIILNTVNIIMWLTASKNYNTGILMVATFVIYLINAIYGYINWNKLIEPTKKELSTNI